jgi:hypothetical protein
MEDIRRLENGLLKQVPIEILNIKVVIPFKILQRMLCYVDRTFH